MKARPFLSALAGVLLSLVLLTSGLLWGMNQRSLCVWRTNRWTFRVRPASFHAMQPSLCIGCSIQDVYLPMSRRLLQPRSVVRHGTRPNVGGMAFSRWRDWISRRNWPAGLALNSA